MSKSIDTSNISEGFYYVTTKENKQRIAYIRPNNKTVRCFVNWDEWIDDIIEIRGPIEFDSLPLIAKVE